MVFILIGTLISFPISFYYGFVVEKRDEMLKQNFVGWLQTALMLIAAYYLMNALNGVGGIRGVTDIAALPILLFCFTVLGELFGLVSNAVSRAAEYAADKFALENTRNYPAFERAFRNLAKDNLSDPNPPAWVEIWLHNHPSIEKRIAAARAWAKTQGV